jgi:ABC-2 type transport system permease protein
MNNGNLYVQLVKRDIEYYLKDFMNLLIYISVFLSGLFVFLTSLKNMLGNSPDYFLFLMTGYLVVSYMNISAGGGFEIIKEDYEGKYDYDKTLPIRRTSYALFRIIGISLRGYINFLICLIMMLPFLILYFSMYKFLVFLLLSFCLSIIFTGFSIIPIHFSKSLTIQTFLGSLLRSWFFLGSTIFYPLSVIPGFLKPIILLNPVTWILELIRISLDIPYAENFPLELSVAFIIFYLLIASLGGIYVLLKYTKHE